MEKVAQLVGEQVSEVYRVLIVDSDENLLALDRLALSKNGFEVETATSASEALGMMGDRLPDLVVLDVVLPDLSGWELLRRVRVSSDEVAVMLLTGRDSDVDKVRGLDLGADDYLTKPFSLQEFEARVRALLRRTRRSPGSNVPADAEPAGEGRPWRSSPRGGTWKTVFCAGSVRPRGCGVRRTVRGAGFEQPFRHPGECAALGCGPEPGARPLGPRVARRRFSPGGRGDQRSEIHRSGAKQDRDARRAPGA